MRSRGPALGLALGSCRPGAAEAPGSRPAVRPPPQRVRSSLEAGGAAPYHARHPPVMSGGAGRLLAFLLLRRPGCPGLRHRLGRGLPAQRLARPAVQLVGDRGQVLRGVRRTGRCPWGSTGAAARWCSRCCRPLPGRVRVAEVDLAVRGDRDLGVQRHLLALVPGQRPAQRVRQARITGVIAAANAAGGLPPGSGSSIVNRVDALDQGADLRLRPCPRSGRLPSARAPPGPRLGGPLADVHHVRGSGRAARLPCAAACAAPARSAGAPPAPGAARPGPARRATGRSSRATPASPAGPGTPLSRWLICSGTSSPPAFLYPGPQLPIDRQLRRLRPPRPLLAPRLRRDRPVPPPARCSCAPPGSPSTRCPAQPRRDLPARLPLRHARPRSPPAPPPTGTGPTRPPARSPHPAASRNHLTPTPANPRRRRRLPSPAPPGPRPRTPPAPPAAAADAPSSPQQPPDREPLQRPIESAPFIPTELIDSWAGAFSITFRPSDVRFARFWGRI